MLDEILFYENIDFWVWMGLRNTLGLTRHFLDEETKDTEGYFSWSSANTTS